MKHTIIRCIKGCIRIAYSRDSIAWLVKIGLCINIPIFYSTFLSVFGCMSVLLFSKELMLTLHVLTQKVVLGKSRELPSRNYLQPFKSSL